MSDAANPLIKNPVNLNAITLEPGSHASGGPGYCVMELVAFMAGEPWSDVPNCADFTITHFAMDLNDIAEPYGRRVREALKWYAPRIIGSRVEDPAKRIKYQLNMMGLDHLTRVLLPQWLRATGDQQADALAGSIEAAPAIVDDQTIKNVEDITHRAAIRSLQLVDALGLAEHTLPSSLYYVTTHNMSGHLYAWTGLMALKSVMLRHGSDQPDSGLALLERVRHTLNNLYVASAAPTTKLNAHTNQMLWDKKTMDYSSDNIRAARALSDMVEAESTLRLEPEIFKSQDGMLALLDGMLKVTGR